MVLGVTTDERRNRADRRRAPLLLSVPEAASLLGISPGHAWTLLRRGDIPHVRLGHRTLVARSFVERVAAGEVAS